MFETVPDWDDEIDEAFPDGKSDADRFCNSVSLDARWRIERLLEMRYLRELLDEPNLGDFT